MTCTELSIAIHLFQAVKISLAVFISKNFVEISCLSIYDEDVMLYSLQS